MSHAATVPALAFALAVGCTGCNQAEHRALGQPVSLRIASEERREPAPQLASEPAVARRASGVTFLGLADSTESPATADAPTFSVRTLSVPDGGQPVVARADAEGTIHLLYDTPGGPLYRKSTDNGKSFGAAIPVVDRGSRKPGLEFHGEAMVVGQGGRIHVALSTNAWKLKLPQREWGFYYASLEPGAKVFTPVRNINGTPSEGFSLAADDRGNVTACWLSDKLFANVSHDNGKTFTFQGELNSAYNPCNCCTTSAVYGKDGELAVLYREETNNERDMYLVLWDQERRRVSRTRVSTTPWKIDACPMSAYAVSRTPRGFIAVWPTREQIYFARLGPKGNLLPPGEIKTPGQAGPRTGMLALSAPDDHTLVAWTRENRLGWQDYDAKGRPAGDAGSSPSSGNGVAGVVDKDGRFILFR
jgi:hypothetical protein